MLKQEKSKFFSIWICFFLFLACFSSIFLPYVVYADTPSGGYIDDGVVWWENKYAKLEVYPAVEKSLCRHTQYVDITWKYPDNIIDIACRYNSNQEVYQPRIWMWQNIVHDVVVEDFGTIYKNYLIYNLSNFELLQETPISVDYGDIPSTYYAIGTLNNETQYIVGFDSWEWLNLEHTNVILTYSYYGKTGDHYEHEYWFDWKEVTSRFQQTIYNNKKYYYVTDFSVIQNTVYHFKYEYNTKADIGSHGGKWDFMAKLSSDTIQEALSSNRYVMVDPWWNSNWDYRMDMFIDHDQVEEAVTNFPVLVQIKENTSLYDNVKTLGDDIAFISTDNSTQYSHEIEYWEKNDAMGYVNASIWVNVTSVSDSADTHFNMYYGNNDASDQSDPTGVWDTSRYLLVYHMNESVGSICYDATNNGIDGTYTGDVPYRVTGFTTNNYGQYLNGTDDYITIPSTGAINTKGTSEYWFYAIVGNQNQAPYVSYGDGNNYVALFLWGDAKTYFSGKYNTVNQWDMAGIITGGYTGNWHHMLGSFDTNDADLIIDGIIKNTDNVATTSAFTKATGYIGCSSAQTLDYMGYLDEIRISKVKLTNGYVYAEYNTMKNITQGSNPFVVFGDIEEGTPADSTAPGIIINFAGNLSDSGGPYWQPPGETTQLTGIFSDGYYTNDSRQQEDWIYINLTVIDDESSVTDVWLNWLNGTTWTNWTYAFNDMTGDYWEYNTSGNIETFEGYNYSFDIVANSSGGSNTSWWNKTGFDGNYTRRYVQLNCTFFLMDYVPFYLYVPSDIIYGSSQNQKKDRLHHDQGLNSGSSFLGRDTGYQLNDIPDDTVQFAGCQSYVGFWFDESICIENTTINNYYYHFWWADKTGKLDGYLKTNQGIVWNSSRDRASPAGYVYTNTTTDESKSFITYNNSVETNSNSNYVDNYSLSTGIIYDSSHFFTDNSIYELSFYASAYYLDNAYPSVISNRSFMSFIIYNIPDNDTLNSSYADTDNDELSDWEELYVTYTNPFISDTDNDGVSDYNEMMSGSDPNNYTSIQEYEFIWIDINNETWNLGTITMNNIYYTNLSNTFTAIKDNCTVNTDLKLQITSDASDWTAATAGNEADVDIYRLNASTDTWAAEDLQVITVTPTTIESNIIATSNQSFDLRFDAPTGSSTGNQQTITITATLVKS